MARRAFDTPGVYAAELWVEDDRGRRDVALCHIKVLPAENRPLPHLCLTCHPTWRVRAGQEVRFRTWKQFKGNTGAIAVAFGDGEAADHCPEHADVAHRYAKPGIYVVRASCWLDGAYPIAEKIKVIVDRK